MPPEHSDMQMAKAGDCQPGMAAQGKYSGFHTELNDMQPLPGAKTDVGANAIDTQREQKSNNFLAVGIMLPVGNLQLVDGSAAVTPASNNLVEKFQHLTPHQQQELVKIGVNTFCQSMVDQSKQIADGVGEGTQRFVKGTVDLALYAGAAAWNLASLPERAGEFAGNLIVNPEKAQTDARNTAADVRHNLQVAGQVMQAADKMCDAADKYVDDAIWGKVNPINDISTGIKKLDESWQKLPLKEKSAIATETVLSFVPIETAVTGAKVLVSVGRSTEKIEEMRAMCTAIDKDLAKVDETLEKYRSTEEGTEATRVRRATSDGPPDGPETNGIEHKSELPREPLRPVIKDVLEVRRKVSKDKIEAAMRVLEELPEADVTALHESGYKIIVTNSLKSAADKFPEEFRTGKGLKTFLAEHADSSHGVAIPETKTIILHALRSDTARAMDTVTHEFGHAMADIRGWEKNEHLRELYLHIAENLRSRRDELEALVAGGERRKELLDELDDLRDLNSEWISGGREAQRQYFETLADMYAIEHGGSRNPRLDAILEEKFGDLLQVMRESNWFRSN